MIVIPAPVGEKGPHIHRVGDCVAIGNLRTVVWRAWGFSWRVWNPAMPLPVADEGIAGFLQQSENRRNSVSPNDSPGTARR